MDSVFGLHFAHAHNAETSDDPLAGLDARSMASHDAPASPHGVHANSRGPSLTEAMPGPATASS
jgi:hypothetical protein